METQMVKKRKELCTQHSCCWIFFLDSIYDSKPRLYSRCVTYVCVCVCIVVPLHTVCLHASWKLKSPVHPHQ